MHPNPNLWTSFLQENSLKWRMSVTKTVVFFCKFTIIEQLFGSYIKLLIICGQSNPRVSHIPFMLWDLELEATLQVVSP